MMFAAAVIGGNCVCEGHLYKIFSSLAALFNAWNAQPDEVKQEE